MLDKNILLTRLLKRTKITEDGHYLWLGAKSRGHGVMGVNGNTGTGVHRLSAYIFHGLDLNNKDIFALHKNSCPHANCWAKDCIYVGNHKDNMDDIKSKDKFKCGHIKSVHGIWIKTERRWKCRICSYKLSRENKRKQWQRKKQQKQTVTI